MDIESRRKYYREYAMKRRFLLSPEKLEEEREWVRRWRRENPKKNVESSRFSRRKSLYGVTREIFEEMWTAQGGRCAICFCILVDDGKNGCHVDHNHRTGVARGLLCGSCNRGIGFLKDSVEVIESASRYLREKGGGLDT